MMVAFPMKIWKIYTFLLTLRDICLGARRCKYLRAILIVMELNLSNTFGHIIWLANQNSFFFFQLIP